MKRRIIAAVAAVVVVAGTFGLVGVTPAAAAYASNGEPVWIPRNATNTADLLRADNRALAKIGNVVYVGGDFTELAPEIGAPAVQQANLAAFNATTGVPIASFAPQLDGKVYAMVASADGTALYVGGSFTSSAVIRSGFRPAVTRPCWPPWLVPRITSVFPSQSGRVAM